jgi:hypothetical protein
MTKERLVPLTGVAFIVLVIVSAVIAGEPPDADSGTDEIVDFYLDNKDAVTVGAALSALAALFLIFFANHLRRLFTAAGERSLSATVLVGAAIIGVGATIDATLLLAMADAADEIEPASVQTLQALWDNDFLPIALGLLTFLLSAGLSILRTGALPRWLGWTALVLVVIGLTPIGWVAFLASAIWVLIVSILLAVRAGTAGEAPPPAAP